MGVFGLSKLEPKAMKDCEWLDRIVEEQRKILGAQMLELVADAARAEELFSLGELEEHALKLRRHGLQGGE